MATLSGRERVLVALAAAGAIAAGGYVYLLEPIRQLNQQAADSIPAREARLARRQLMIAERDVLSRDLKQINERIERESARLLQGPTPPLAASELQKMVKDLAAETGAEVRSERVLPTAERDGLVEVPLEITVAAGIRESVDLIYRLERTGKLLTLQDLKARVVSVGQPKDLLTTLTVSGYLLSPPSAPPKPGEKPPPELGKRGTVGG